MFEYTLKGIVRNGDGLSLALYYSDLNLDDRSIVVIQNGGFTFEGSCQCMRTLNIRFEENIDKRSGYHWTNIQTEPGVITIKFDVTGDPSSYRFSNYEVLAGPNNIFRRQFFTEYKKVLGDRPMWVGPESSQMDYMRKYVYPGGRSRVLKHYEQYFEKDISAIHLFLLKSITDRTQGPGMFKRDLLDKQEIDTIKRLFSKIDRAVCPGIDYDVVKATVEQLDHTGPIIDFVDFQLDSIDGSKKQLSDIVKSNNYTLLTFWHTACAPCRTFHNQINEIYSDLQDAGIEIVSINVDDSKKLWIESSKRDKISWPNLYVGRASEMLARYQVKCFPIRRAYDENLEYVAADFQNNAKWWTTLKKKTTDQ